MPTQKTAVVLPQGMALRIAKSAQVSVTTVYNVLNNKPVVAEQTRLKVAQAYSSAKKSLAKQRKKTAQLLADE